jgi:hypothetical protein
MKKEGIMPKKMDQIEEQGNQRTVLSRGVRVADVPRVTPRKMISDI